MVDLFQTSLGSDEISATVTKYIRTFVHLPLLHTNQLKAAINIGGTGQTPTRCERQWLPNQTDENTNEGSSNINFPQNCSFYLRGLEH